eukprot:2547586-Amphidinium_carterae.1
MERAAQTISGSFPANRANMLVGKQSSLYRRPKGLWRVKRPDGCAAVITHDAAGAAHQFEPMEIATSA